MSRRLVHTTKWVCAVCGQHGVSWPGAFLATFWAHYAARHAVTDTTVSIFARTR